MYRSKLSIVCMAVLVLWGSMVGGTKEVSCGAVQLCEAEKPGAVTRCPFCGHEFEAEPLSSCLHCPRCGHAINAIDKS